jgi:hypothetical protein
MPATHRPVACKSPSFANTKCRMQTKRAQRQFAPVTPLPQDLRLHSCSAHHTLCTHCLQSDNTAAASIHEIVCGAHMSTRQERQDSLAACPMTMLRSSLSRCCMTNSSALPGTHKGGAGAASFSHSSTPKSLTHKWEQAPSNPTQASQTSQASQAMQAQKTRT